MNFDTRIFHGINNFTLDTPGPHPIVSGYANYGVVLFAGLLLAGWWNARRDTHPDHMTAAVWAPLARPPPWPSTNQSPPEHD
jgi:undecaprenyl-diphosphatase